MQAFGMSRIRLLIASDFIPNHGEEESRLAQWMNRQIEVTAIVVSLRQLQHWNRKAEQMENKNKQVALNHSMLRKQCKLL